MTRAQLEHIIRASAVIADDDEIIVVGSQSILGAHPDAPDALTTSIEADVFPKNHPDRWELIDGSIGELSPFHDTFGYYAQGVDETTSTLPEGWRERLVEVRNDNTRGATGWCLEPHDLLVAKAIAGRPKDKAFVETALRHRLASPDRLLERLKSTDTEVALAERAQRWFQA